MFEQLLGNVTFEAAMDIIAFWMIIIILWMYTKSVRIIMYGVGMGRGNQNIVQSKKNCQ